MHTYILEYLLHKGFHICCFFIMIFQLPSFLFFQFGSLTANTYFSFFNLNYTYLHSWKMCMLLLLLHGWEPSWKTLILSSLFLLCFLLRGLLVSLLNLSCTHHLNWDNPVSFPQPSPAHQERPLAMTKNKLFTDTKILVGPISMHLS